jgi:hypothetical protein
MSFNNWVPKGLYNENGSPTYSTVKSKGTEFAAKLLETMSRRKVKNEETGAEETVMLAPPPLPMRRSDMR